MEVPVAGVKDVDHGESIIVREPAHTAQHFGKALARDGPVHAEIICCDAADRWKGGLAPRPEREALGLACRDPQARRSARTCNPRDLLAQIIAFGGDAVDLDDRPDGADSWTDWTIVLDLVLPSSEGLPPGFGEPLNFRVPVTLEVTYT